MSSLLIDYSGVEVPVPKQCWARRAYSKPPCRGAVAHCCRPITTGSLIALTLGRYFNHANKQKNGGKSVEGGALDRRGSAGAVRSVAGLIQGSRCVDVKP